MAQRLKRPFKILWTKEPLRQYVDYTAFDAERVDTKNPLPPYIHRVYAIDDPNILRRYLETERGPLFPHAACKFILNLEVARFLYTNPRFAAKRDDYLSDMLAAYRLLYSLFLVPRPHIRAAAEAVVADPDGRPCVGIQIRAGDVYMRYGGSHTVLKDPATIVPAMLAAVKSHVDASAGWGDSYTVFVTSDWSGALEAARCVWSQDRVFYNNDAIQHIDRPVEGDFSKVYVDNWILATKTARLYITACSNYGRVAALAAPHDAVYDVGTLALLAKKDLLSKS